jgi:CarD family transcriptional regulator
MKKAAPKLSSAKKTQAATMKKSASKEISKPKKTSTIQAVANATTKPDLIKNGSAKKAIIAKTTVVKSTIATNKDVSNISINPPAPTHGIMIEFKAGDKVVYPAHGVGIVEKVEAKLVGGSEHKFYQLKIMETGMKIMVPVRQVSSVGLRKVIDMRTIDEVYKILRDRKVSVVMQTWNRRHREYTQKIKTGSLFEIAKVIRDLSVLKSDKELSFGERKMLDTAQGLLVKEISIAKSRTEDVIREELQQICSRVH